MIRFVSQNDQRARKDEEHEGKEVSAGDFLQFEEKLVWCRSP